VSAYGRIGGERSRRRKARTEATVITEDLLAVLISFLVRDGSLDLTVAHKAVS
jgi:hypothetical protein